MDAKYTKKDMQLLAAVTAYVEQYISKQVITLAMAGDSLQMSHEAIHYKIRSLTGLSGSEFILRLTSTATYRRLPTEAASRTSLISTPVFSRSMG